MLMGDVMNMLKIKPVTIENGPGCRVSVFVAGCPHHCDGCFQPETWDFSAGVPFSEEWVDEIIDYVNESFIQGATLLGGEPLCEENIHDTLQLCSIIKARTGKDIVVYTGYTFEELLGNQLSKYPRHAYIAIDYLIDGRFIKSLKDPSLKFRGSSNQRILDFQKSYKEGRPIELDL